MGKKQALRLFLLRHKIDGAKLSDFTDAVISDPDKPLDEYDLRDAVPNLDGKLYVYRAEPSEPDWKEFLDGNFTAELQIDSVSSYSALLILRVKIGRANRYFAFTFGNGRYLLRPDSYERRFGLEIAISLIYGEGNKDPDSTLNRIRDVNYRRVGYNTLNTKQQYSRPADLEAFDLDIDRDFCFSLTGIPQDPYWGTRITGAHNLSVSGQFRFEDLAELCKKSYKVYKGKAYVTTALAWIDNVSPVDETPLISKLDMKLAELLRSGETDRLYLAPPQMVDWEDQPAFTYSVETNVEHDDLDLDQFLDILNVAGLKQTISADYLKRLHIEMDSPSLATPVRWSALKCIAGEITHSVEGELSTYVRYDGKYFEVQAQFLDALNDRIEDIEELVGEIPNSMLIPDGTANKEMPEANYNDMAADSSPEYIMMDRQTVRLDMHTTPIEVCDVFSTTGRFIHVKRKLGSSSLSHLFNQGYVSAELFKASTDFRLAFQEKLQEAEAEREQFETHRNGEVTEFAGRFSNSFDANELVRTSDYTVVYAIVAEWDDRSLVEALPFFSKLTLRQQVRELEGMGYNVAFSRIDIDNDLADPIYHYSTEAQRRQNKGLAN